jgi:ATP-dependent helicase/nuclease subunit A
MNAIHSAVHAYEIDDAACDSAAFTAAACDPQQSVVVEACAGSGKTWLLVARMLRLLLAGAEPSELLAITFTRKAAQEMRERLEQLLRELALAAPEQARQLLRERGVAEHELSTALSKAQRLYDKILASPQAVAVDTFHSWFGRLIRLAPLSSGVPHGFNLVEGTAELQREAYGQLMQSLKDPANAEIKDALLFLYDTIGDFNARNMLNAFLDKRAEWWAANDNADDGAPLEWLAELIGDDAEVDARLALWNDEGFCQRVQFMALVLGGGGKRNQENAVAIEKAFTEVKANGASLDYFDLLCSGFLTSEGSPRRHGTHVKAMAASVEKHLGPDSVSAFEDECQALAETLIHYQRRSEEPLVMQVNQALFKVGVAYVDCYQTLKADQRALDFSDLEWQAYRLLNNEEIAAYLHSRLDARYKHILLDEFQDTNPLQWGIVQAWLDAYGADSERPTVFIVGDPKQSIYRFRRAEPRVFSAAAALLKQQGAKLLRTNQTRRNAPDVVDALNHAMDGNALFHPQTTASTNTGAVWRLPLIRSSAEEKSEEAAQTGYALRDPLTTLLEEAEDQRRLEEGKQLARTLLQLKLQSQRDGSGAWKWSEVMLLVRRRTYLSAYEKALRDAGIPFVSSRRGGLLNALEVADLIALLNFLITPGDNRSLAHVLKSPIMSATDAHLILLAQRDEASWWKRLQALVSLDAKAHPALTRAVTLLTQWMQSAHDLPVHDLLDRILHQGELLARYAQHAAAADRAQVVGNIHAFIELALSLDAGRYPSLPKFIAALSEFQRADADAPDESAVDSAADAVRILTIHSAKGLEAEIVAMVDANHSEAKADTLGILVNWPLEQGSVERKHFSVFGSKGLRGAARDALFEQDQAQAAQENWNMLYVAVTRAKKHLIVSGIANDRTGVVEGSWYDRLKEVAEFEFDEEQNVDVNAGAMEENFSLELFTPPSLALPELALPVSQSEEQLEGVALHTLMERLTASGAQQLCSITLPDAEVIASWLPCSSTIAQRIRTQAAAILANPALARFFDPAVFVRARNEMDVLYQGELLRLDRVVVFEDEVWVLDYKRALLDSERIAYTSQLQTYMQALSGIFADKRLRAGLILADGQLIEVA